MTKIIPAQVTLNALRDGQVMNELAQAIHDATAAMLHHGKAATVTLALSIEPVKGVSAGLRESPFVIRAKVVSKLPEAEPPTTIFYADEDCNPTQNAPARQPTLGLSVAPTTGAGNAT